MLNKPMQVPMLVLEVLLAPWNAHDAKHGAQSHLPRSCCIDSLMLLWMSSTTATFSLHFPALQRLGAGFHCPVVFNTLG